MNRILTRQPLLLGPDGQPIRSSEATTQVDAEVVAEDVSKLPIQEARKRANAMGFRIVKQTANQRRGNIRRAKKAALRRNLKGTGKSFADYYRETRQTGPSQKALERAARKAAGEGNG
jgi:hypothetical protein